MWCLVKYLYHFLTKLVVVLLSLLLSNHPNDLPRVYKASPVKINVCLPSHIDINAIFQLKNHHDNGIRASTKQASLKRAKEKHFILQSSTPTSIKSLQHQQVENHQKSVLALPKSKKLHSLESLLFSLILIALILGVCITKY